MKVSNNFYRSLRLRAPQIHPTWTLPRRAHHMEYHLDCAQNLGSSPRQWAKMRPWSLNTARCRTSGVRAPRIMETHMGSARSTLPHIRSARTGDHDDIRETQQHAAAHQECAHRGTHNILGHSHPGSGRRFRGHAHPGSGRCSGHAHPGTQRRQKRAQPRPAISTQRTTHTRG